MNNQNSSENKSPVMGWAIPVFKRINDLLFKPSAHITEVGERKHAELIAKLALFFAALIIVGLTTSISRPDRNVGSTSALAALTIASLSGYVVSRTRNYKSSGIIIATIWTIVTIAYAYSGRTTNGPLFALVLLLPFGFILGTVMLPTRSLAMVVIAGLISAFMLPLFYPEIGRPIFTSVGTLTCMGGLALIAQRHRDEVERERLRVLTDKNNNLQTLQASLELVNQKLERRIDERENLISELESKNAELERFTYTVSHDLKSPLITIGGFLGYVEANALKGDIKKLKEDIQRIKNAVDKMQRLLDELLELSRIGRIMNPSENIPFEEIVRDALENVKGRLDEGKIEVMVGSDLPVVHGDRVRLVEVVQNLFDNAAKFMGDQPKPLIEIDVRKQESKNIFFVQDNGIGISPKYHDKIFELFDKVNPKSEGTGIGLALVKRIVNVHEGKIWVESQGKGTGTTFYFTLPQKPNNEQEASNDG